jgi:hypothetical protein
LRLETKDSSYVGLHREKRVLVLRPDLPDWIEEDLCVDVRGLETFPTNKFVFRCAIQKVMEAVKSEAWLRNCIPIFSWMNWNY